MQDIQREEESLRIASLSKQGSVSVSGPLGQGHSSPWYVERRARALSVEAVVRAEEEGRREEEELQAALRAVEEFEMREGEKKKGRMKGKGKIR